MLANLTGAGRRDLIVADNLLLKTFVNDGAGHFTLRGSYDIASRVTFDATTGDLNADGFDDVVVVHGVPFGQIPTGPPLLTVFLNAGDGTLTRTMYSLPDAGQTVVLGDLDGDHRPDVLVGATAGKTYLLQNLGGGALGAAAALSVDGGLTAIADMDGDGKQDLIVRGRALEVQINQGGLIFSEPKFVHVLSSLGLDVQRFILVDVDGDAAIDVVMLGHVPMVDPGQRTVEVALNDGTGALSSVYAAKVALTSGGLAVGDLDKDGRPDIVVSGAPITMGGTGQLDLLLATNAGSYAPSSCPALVAASGASAVSGNDSLAAGDLNGDGRADLVILRSDGVAVLVSGASSGTPPSVAAP